MQNPHASQSQCPQCTEAEETAHQSRQRGCCCAAHGTTPLAPSTRVVSMCSSSSSSTMLFGNTAEWAVIRVNPSVAPTSGRDRAKSVAPNVQRVARDREYIGITLVEFLSMHDGLTGTGRDQIRRSRSHMHVAKGAPALWFKEFIDHHDPFTRSVRCPSLQEPRLDTRHCSVSRQSPRRPCRHRTTAPRVLGPCVRPDSF